MCAQIGSNRFCTIIVRKSYVKTSAKYSYIEVLQRTFLATTGVQSWRQEDVFAKEPVRRMILAMNPYTVFLGTHQTILTIDQNFCLNEINNY